MGKNDNQQLAVDTRRAAELLSVSPRTLEGLRVRGDGPLYSKVGGRVVYPVDRLRQYLDERECRCTAERRD